jgi:hypothetical protein
MIGVDDILDILKITVYSGALEKENPLSTILIASVGGGKTTMLKKTHQKGKVKKVQVPGSTKGQKREIEVREIVGSVLYTTNTTPYVIYTRYGRELKSGQIKHIAIPDFLNILNLPKNQLGSVISFYNNLIEEGLISIESRDGQFISEVPVTIGLITAVSQQDFNKRQSDWGAIGFLSRVLPVSFRYSSETAEKVRQSIKDKDYLKELESFNITLPQPRNIDIPPHIADHIERIALKTKDSNDELGARRLKQLQVFAMANALMEERDEVDIEDLAKLFTYDKYFNTNCIAEI